MQARVLPLPGERDVEPVRVLEGKEERKGLCDDPVADRVLLKVSGMRTRGSSLLRISRARSRCSSGGGVGISSGTCFLFGLALSYIRP